jgi:hypothetical protein
MTVKRRRVGSSGFGYTIDGTKAPGVTSIISMVPKNLTDWAARTAADYAIDNWADLDAMPLSQRQKLIANAHHEARDSRAKRGTEVHKLGEALVAGETVAVPDELAGHVEAYRDWLDAVEPKPVEGGTELLFASREHTYCGTGDLIADLPDIMADGEFIPACRWLLDLKTAAGLWPESALQLTGYRRADVFGVPLDWCGECDEETRILTGPRGGLSKCEACHPDRAGFEERPVDWLEIKRCGVVWIKSDTCELHPVDTGDEVWEFFLRLRWLYDRMETTRTGSLTLPRGWIGPPASAVTLVAADRP